MVLALGASSLNDGGAILKFRGAEGGPSQLADDVIPRVTCHDKSDDTFTRGKADDSLSATGGGNDVIILGAGDQATGGTGADTFIRLAKRTGELVIIKGFDDTMKQLPIESPASARP